MICLMKAPVSETLVPLHQCVGVDISKLSFTACVCKKYMDDNIWLSDVCEFPNSKTGFNQLVKWSRKHLVKEIQCTYLMEPTGVYYEELAYHLHDKVKAQVIVILPNKIKSYAEYLGIHTKTDEMDCRILAQIGAKESNLKLWEPALPVFRELRSLCRFATDMKRLETQLNNHLEALENSAYPEQSVIKHYKSMLKDLHKRMDENEDAIRAKVATDDKLNKRVEKVVTIPGVGFSTVVTILAETNGFELITNRKQLAKYAGFDIVDRDSGTTVKGKKRISKKGNSRIRAALYFPAMVATRYNPELREDYRRIIEKHPDHKMIGVTALQRKLLLLIYTLWKSGEVYRKMD